jgi:hypothetical protein
MSDPKTDIQSVGHLDNPYDKTNIKPRPLQNVRSKVVDLKKITLQTARLLFGGHSKFKPFWRTLKRTVTGKNKAGKIIHHVVVAAAGIFAGTNSQAIINLFYFLFNSQPQPQTSTIMLHFNLLTLIIIIAGAIIHYIDKHYAKKGERESVAKEALAGVDEVFSDLRQFRKRDSDKGTRISKKERQKILLDIENNVVNVGKKLAIKYLPDYISGLILGSGDENNKEE